MTGQCCTGEGPSRRLARRLSGAAASILPGAVLALLPKCPLCLAVWLTVVTGAAVPAAVAARVRGLILAVWVGGVGLAAAQIVRGLLKNATVAADRANSRTHLQTHGRVGVDTQVVRALSSFVE